MSSLVYGIVKGKRVAAPARQSRTTGSPGIGTYVDTIAALVPAEALALYAGVVIPFATHTSSVHGKKVTVISNPGLLEWSCAGLLALSSLLYLVGRKKPNLDWGILSIFIPPAAFAAWMLVQNPSVWDIWWPSSNIGERTVITAFAAVLLGILANTLSVWADAKPGVLAVTGVSPNTGPVAGKTKVTVRGSGFTTPKAVNFGQEPARNLKFVDDTKLTVTSPQATAAGAVDVTVITSAGQTSPISPADQFTYNGPPTAPIITSVNPDRGPVAGGTNVTVTGTGFTDATDAKFGQAAVQNLAVVSDTQLTVVSPQATGPAGPTDVTVTTPAGTSPTSPADHFTYEPAPAAPTVTGIDPDRGPVAGGTNVTVTGTGLTDATEVNFGQAAAQNLTVVSGTQLTVTSPPGAAGTVGVTVTTPAGTSPTTPGDQFMYELLP